MQKVQGIILRSVDYGERDKILSLALSDGSVISASAKGVRSAKAKLKAYVGLLTFGEFILTDGRAGYIVSSADPIDSFYNCWNDAEKAQAAVFCCSVYQKAFRNGGEPTDFLNLVKALKEINYGETLAKGVALSFLYRVSVSLGVEVVPESEYFNRIFAQLDSADVEEVETLDLTEGEADDAIGLILSLFKSDLGITVNI
jgi:DNA repair protein RecO